VVCVVSLAYSVRLVIRSRASLPGNYRAPTPAGCRQPIAAAKTAAQSCRATAVGVAVAGMARLAHGRPHCQAGDRPRMAPPRVSPVLDLEESRTPWAAGCASRRAHPDPRAVDRESALGCAAASLELLKLGISVSQSTVAKYMRRYPRPSSQTWRAFLTNHASQIMAADLFVVPTVTFRLLFVLIILAHDRRRLVHMAVTEHPTAAWTTQQLRNAFPEHDPISCTIAIQCLPTSRPRSPP
jgi:hypothetical protein